MLAPNGYVDTFADPSVQATTRPPGTLLEPSAGYDSIREGKNKFQGKGPTGGFRPMTFAEDIGGTGAVLSVIPGQTTAIQATEYLDGGPGMTPEGAVLIADRSLNPVPARTMHAGYNTLPDMGDRTPGRPLSKMMAMGQSPIRLFQKEYKKDPLLAVLGGVGLVAVLVAVANDVEKGWRGRDLGSAAENSPAETGAAVDKGVDAIKEVTDDAVKAISDASKDAVDAVSKAGQEAVDTVRKAAE